MIKKLFLLLLLPLCTFGQVALHGLYTPVHLNFDTTRIYLRDYLADLKATKFELPEGLTNHSNSNDTLILTGAPKQKLSTINLITTDGVKSLLLVASSQKKVNFMIPQSLMVHGDFDVRIIGAFNYWNRESPPLLKRNDAFVQTYVLAPGRYEYKLYMNGQELLDPSNKDSVSNGMGGYNNVLVVEEEGAAPGNFEVNLTEENSLKISSLNGPINYVAFWNNEQITLPCNRKMPPDCTIPIPEKAKKIKRSYIRIYSFAGKIQSKDVLIPLEYGKPVMDITELDRSDWHQARMYFLMVDRFNNGNKANDLKTPDDSINPKANYYGGDLAGVDQKVKDGFFDSLHVNTIWLSPITQNPLDAWGYWKKGKVKSKFSGYHGYWPISNTKVDFRFGSEKEVKTLLDDAHAENKNVILDYVANHVHIQHPVYQNNKSWATPLYLPDGTKNTEKWDEHRLTTWFDDHLPTLDLRRWEVVDPMVDSAMFWITNYSFDGFRHDATKHIDELYWRTLTYRIRTSTDKPVYQVGETYGSPQLINSYIATGMLDAQFDFNLYDAAVSAFANEDGSLEQLKAKLDQGLSVYGHHHLMGNITGNQDRSRFITLSSGEARFDEDQKLAGWDREIGKPSAEAYKRLALLHAFNNAVPGIPCIYYGDEYGMPGAGDPDNRRMMEFDGLDEDEKQLLEKVKELNKLRGSQLPLIYGSTNCRIENPEVMIIERNYLGQKVVAIINTSETEFNGILDIIYTKNDFVKVIGGNGIIKFPLNGYASVAVPPLSYVYLSIK